MRCFDEISCFLSAEFSFLMVWDRGETDIEGWESLSVNDGLLDVAWFCACKLGGSLAEDACKFCGDSWCKCECVGDDVIQGGSLWA